MMRLPVILVAVLLAASFSALAFAEDAHDSDYLSPVTTSPASTEAEESAEGEATEAEESAEESTEATENMEPPVEEPLSEDEATEEVAATPPPRAPTDLVASDTPNSAGDSISLEWKPSANEIEAGVVGYGILRSESREGPFHEVGEATIGASRSRDTDSRNIHPGKEMFYKVVARTADGVEVESNIASAIAEKQWFHQGRLVILSLALLLSGAILYNISRARRGADLYVRRIAGLESVEEAIGRATEMGKPVLYIPGIRDMDDIQTIASMSILSHVAKLTAEYDTPILVPNIKAVVMSTAQEVVKQAYLDAGRPDAYQSENIRYLTDDQFGYVAGVDGIMLRDKPAANFFLGAFFAESLILAETGASTGAIQVAGTAMPSQLPFFVAACDYTLIGEELFAASAYLAREPMLLGSLKGQDWGKFAFMILIGVGALAATVVAVGGLDSDVWWNIHSWFKVE